MPKTTLVSKQIGIPYWLDEHIQEVCKAFDVSYGQIVRLYMFTGINDFCAKAGWEDAKHLKDSLKNLITDILENRVGTEIMDKYSSDAAYRARQGLEWRKQMLLNIDTPEEDNGESV